MAAAFSPGSAVVVQGLPACQGFNGRRGRVEQLVSGETYQVRLSSGLRVQVLAKNLEIRKEEADESSDESSDISSASSNSSASSEDEDRDQQRRTALLRDFFTLLDPNGKGSLRASEIYHFATACGFRGGPDEWSKEYQALCKLCDVSDGFSSEDFERLVSDQALPTYCATWELPGMMEQSAKSLLKANPSRQRASTAGSTPALLELPGEVKRKSSRRRRDSRLSRASVGSKRGSKGRLRQSKLEKVRKTIQESQDRRDAVAFLFRTLDADGDERLNLPEMERFASLCGFTGEWATEYEVMCEVLKIDVSRGADFVQFNRVVSDEKSLAYCNDEELRQMVLHLKSEREGIESQLAAIRIQAGARGFLTRTQVRRSQVPLNEPTVHPTTLPPGSPPVPRSPAVLPRSQVAGAPGAVQLLVDDEFAAAEPSEESCGLPEPPSAPWSDED